MPIKTNGDIVTGEDARAKIVDNLIANSDLTVNDLEFIMKKLKSAEYKGSEFEQFYAIWVKLTASLETLKLKK